MPPRRLLAAVLAVAAIAAGTTAAAAAGTTAAAAPPGPAVTTNNAISSSFADTFADPAFMAEAEKIGLIVNAPQTGEQLQAVLARAYATPARVVERLQKLNNP